METNSDQGEPGLRVHGPNHAYDPGVPRLQGRGSIGDSPGPGVPRSEGRDLDNRNSPGVPRLQGRGSISDSPGVPRSEGRDFDNRNNPGVPRLQGRGSVSDSPGVPRSEGRDFDNRNSPGVPRLQGRGSIGDSPGVPRSEGRDFDDRNSSGEIGQAWGHDETELPRRDLELESGRESEGHRSNGHRRRRSSSESSGERSHPQSKRSRLSESRDRDSDMLDKFLDILKQIKSSDKPKLSTFNTNVIPEFDPMSKEQTVLTWLTKVEECGTIYQWGDREMIHYALPKLTGVAKTWYQGLPSVLFTWTEWKRKLIESFPCREDYAELLTEMLSKRVRYGESLEHYYYAKVNLLNRCKINGKQAVDCILYGVEDRAVKVGAQAAQFSEPEQVLKYFRTVKIGQNRDRDHQDLSHKSRYNNRNQQSTQISTSMENTNLNIKCYNCNEFGHRSNKCSKPAVQCTYCEKMGHLEDYCFKKSRKVQERNEAQSVGLKEKPTAEAIAL